jgi:signal transduction histidine kinase
MKFLRVFLIDTTQLRLEVLRRSLSGVESIKAVVPMLASGDVEGAYRDVMGRIDAIVFGESVSSKAIIQFTQLFRSYGIIVPVFILRKQSEAQVPGKLRKAGVDDVLNIVEIDTPLFSWTFVSAVEHALLKRKAREFDGLHRRLKTTSDALATMIHAVNTPLSIVRLAMYHLEDPALPADKRDTFLRILVSGLQKIDLHMKDLSSIRRLLNGEQVTSPNVLLITSSKHVSASR